MFNAVQSEIAAVNTRKLKITDKHICYDSARTNPVAVKEDYFELT
jgi:hypothetical protein